MVENWKIGERWTMETMEMVGDVEMPDMAETLDPLEVGNPFWKRWEDHELAGGFKDFLFSPLFGEDSHFD